MIQQDKVESSRIQQELAGSSRIQQNLVESIRIQQDLSGSSRGVQLIASLPGRGDYCDQLSCWADGSPGRADCQVRHTSLSPPSSILQSLQPIYIHHPTLATWWGRLPSKTHIFITLILYTSITPPCIHLSPWWGRLPSKTHISITPILYTSITPPCTHLSPCKDRLPSKAHNNGDVYLFTKLPLFLY